MTEVAGLLLAAGAGRRYGMPKALVGLDGQLLVERAVATLRAGGCTPVVVVLGAAADVVRERADLGDAILLDNPDWSSGMGSSLRCGLTYLDSTAVDAAIVLLVDTPGISSLAVDRLRERAAADALAVATYRGEPGHPVVLGRDHWAGAAAMAIGDAGARRYLATRTDEVRFMPCDDLADGADLDYPSA